MNRFFKSVLLVFVILTSAQSLFADEQIELKEHFLHKIDQVVKVVENSSLSKIQRNEDIIKILEPTFDFELMAKLSLGRTWKTLAKDERKKFVELYVKRMRESYSSKIDSYNGEKVEVRKIEQPKSNRIAIITDLAAENNSLEIIYKFYKPKNKINGKDNWLVYDAEISGVSILKTDIAQFKEFLKTKTIYELMDALSKS